MVSVISIAVLLSISHCWSGWLGSNQRPPRPKRGMHPLHHTQLLLGPGAGQASGLCPRPLRRGRRAACAETVEWRKGGELNAQGLRSPVFKTGAVANRLALPYGPSGRYRTRTSGVSNQRADFYATDGWSRCPEACRDRRCTRAVLSLIELRRHLIADCRLKFCNPRSAICNTDGASGGGRSRNLRDVNTALCHLSYAGLVGSGGIEPLPLAYQTGALSHCATIRRFGPQRFELRSACYKQAALTVELRAA
jgi:hypothetical protein